MPPRYWTTVPATSSGYLYLIANDHFEGWVKVGQSTDPDRRLAQYQTSDPTRSYELIFSVPCRDRRQSEWLAHERLKKLGFEYSSEWFRVDLDTARRVVAKAAAADPLTLILPQKEQIERTHRRHGDGRLLALPAPVKRQGDDALLDDPDRDA